MCKISGKEGSKELHTNDSASGGDSNVERHLEDLVTLESKKDEKANCEYKHVGLICFAELKYALGNHSPIFLKFIINFAKQKDFLELFKETGCIKASNLSKKLIHMYSSS